MKNARFVVIVVSLMVICFGVFSELKIKVAMAVESIQHDAEHYVLLHQYKDKWATEDKELA